VGGGARGGGMSAKGSRCLGAPRLRLQAPYPTPGSPLPPSCAAAPTHAPPPKTHLPHGLRGEQQPPQPAAPEAQVEVVLVRHLSRRRAERRHVVAAVHRDNLQLAWRLGWGRAVWRRGGGCAGVSRMGPGGGGGAHPHGAGAAPRAPPPAPARPPPPQTPSLRGSSPFPPRPHRTKKGLLRLCARRAQRQRRQRQRRAARHGGRAAGAPRELRLQGAAVAGARARSGCVSAAHPRGARGGWSSARARRIAAYAPQARLGPSQPGPRPPGRERRACAIVRPRRRGLTPLQLPQEQCNASLDRPAVHPAPQPRPTGRPAGGGQTLRCPRADRPPRWPDGL
jgi:hypothetical protein